MATSTPAPVPEFVAGKVDDFPAGQMKEVNVNEDLKILVGRTETGKLFASGAKCSHYGAPLVKGVLKGERVTCPWHAACFNVCTGDIEDAPAFDKIDSFAVRVSEGGEVLVTIPKDLPKGFRRPPTLVAPNEKEDSRVFVVVGAGAAGVIAVQTLRESGFKGKIVLVGKEPHVPYDRIKCSKTLNLTLESIAIRPPDFYAKNGIDLLLGREATSLALPDVVSGQKGIVGLSDGTLVDFDSILIATGGNCRTLKCEGHELKNIFTVRFIEDANGIGEAAKKAKKVVIIGSSFIGMEIAACLVAKKIPSISVVGMEKVPFERVLGVEIGTVMQQLHESKGIKFHMQRTLKRYIPGPEGYVGGVELDNGEILEADMIVVGAGIIPATEFLRGVLVLERDGSIVVDEHLRAANGVYVAGDIAHFKYAKTGEVIRVEHWDVAQQHGRVAARNMAGFPTVYDSIPFFWTSQFNAAIRYAGNAMRWDEILFKGSLADLKFAAYYIFQGKANAVTTVGVDPLAVAVSELMRLDRMPSPEVLRENPLEFPISLLAQ
eukprot:TRINITY_DN6626_c0_g5_i1.p1 TRINITY_DN6626_c0_g5~~TRINITY_DN6626_c0_g5_i1.p1  ORF type:complete len:621 (+),score=214.68 TRINITY_DN6626_c0_g5_i1:223-1863(+)